MVISLIKTLAQNGILNSGEYRLQIATLHICLCWYEAASAAALQRGLGTHLVRHFEVYTDCCR